MIILTGLRSKLPTSILTYILFCVFGIGSWIAVNGIWAEIAILVVTLPECYTLPAILVITIQCANLGPLAYTIIKYLFIRCQQSSSKEYYLEVGAVFTLVTVGTVACVLLVILWDNTAYLFGAYHSIALIVLTFFVALVDCTSSVVFLPFMKHFPAEYISALYVGEGSSGVLASVVALSQGFVSNNITSCMYNYTGIEDLGIHFSPNVYFIFLAVMMALCGLAFLGINVLPTVRKQMLPLTQPYSQLDSSVSTTTENNTRTESPDSRDNNIFGGSDSERDDMFEDSFHDASESEELTPHTDSPEMILPRDRQQGRLQKSYPSPVETKTKDSSPAKQRRFHIKDKKEETVITRTASGPLLKPLSSKRPSQFTLFVKILWSNFTIYFCLGLVNFLTNGALPAISPYVFINYGNEVYHIAVNLALFINPIICVFYLLVSHKSTVITVMLTAIALLLSIYLLVAAIMSPDPWLKTQLLGKILIVVVNVLITGIVSYTKVGVVAKLHSSTEDKDTALLLAGIATQIGSLVGAVIFFFVSKRFTQP